MFVEEDYGAVSALLGERAKPFLGIPLGPLQVGHFIGALGIILMAFVEYPGFPLTNLPTPLRSCLQGGKSFVDNLKIGCFLPPLHERTGDNLYDQRAIGWVRRVQSSGERTASCVVDSKNIRRWWSRI